MSQIINTNLVLNEIVIKGNTKSINSIISKLKINELASSNIKSLFPIPKEIQELETVSEIDIATQIKLYNKYKVYSYQEWIEQYWGTDEFNNIEKIEISENEIKFSFYSEYTDSKLILINIQRRNPKININSVFTFLSNDSLEQFDTLFNDEEVHYSINNEEWIKFKNHIEFIVRKIEVDNNFNQLAIAA